MLFDAPDNVLENPKFKSDGQPRFLAVPFVEGSNFTSVRTLMCDFTAPVLSEMMVVAKQLLALPTLDSPMAADNRQNGPRDRRNSAPGNGGLSPYTADSAANKRKTVIGFGGIAVTGPTTTLAERIRGKGKGRVHIAVAQLYLMAGRIPDALRE